MTVVNHWGFWVSDNTPVTGVIQLNSLEWIDDEIERHEIANLTYEDGWEEYKREKTNEFVNAFWDNINLYDESDYDDPQPSEELIEEWQEEYSQFDQPPSTYLVGSWLLGKDGKYEIDHTGEYAAIVSYDSMTAQVVFSQWVTRGALCSPCYPGQVDLDTPGEYLGYDFPPELYGDRRQNDQSAQEWIVS